MLSFLVVFFGYIVVFETTGSLLDVEQLGDLVENSKSTIAIPVFSGIRHYTASAFI